MNTEDLDQKEEAGKRKQPGWRQTNRAGEDWGVVWGLENCGTGVSNGKKCRLSELGAEKRENIS